MVGCKSEEEESIITPDTPQAFNSCEGCHTNYAVLKEVYTPDPPSDG